jgi:hypothetical protein
MQIIQLNSLYKHGPVIFLQNTDLNCLSNNNEFNSFIRAFANSKVPMSTQNTLC